MKLVDFQFEHLDLFDWRPEEMKMYNVGSELVRALAAAEKGECFTAMHDGRVLVIGGIIKQSAKTGYAFTIFSAHAAKYPVTAARLVKRMFSRMVEDMGLHRIVTWNMLEASSHHKWCEWLGFKLEGVARKFDDEGNDYIQYGLVTDGN